MVWVMVVVARGLSDRYELQKVVAAGFSCAGITAFCMAEQYLALSLPLRPSSSMGVATTDAMRTARKKDFILRASESDLNKCERIAVDTRIYLHRGYIYSLYRLSTNAVPMSTTQLMAFWLKVSTTIRRAWNRMKNPKPPGESLPTKF